MTIIRKEVIGDCTLIQGDCLEVMPTLGNFDAVVTDPVWPNAPDGMFPSVTDPTKLLAAALSKADAKRCVIIVRTDSDPRFLCAVPTRWKYVRHQNLEYVATGYLGRVLGGMEVAYCFGEPIPSAPGQRVIVGHGPKVQPSTERFDHPCARNIEHMKFLVRWWSEPYEHVLDPFMGSGTTGVACAKMGRKFTGIELDPGYFDIACKRIEEAYRQPDMFVEAPAKPKQEAMF